MNTEQAAALRKPFSKAQIGKLPKGGTQLDYVGHAVVTDRLLEVDPEWTYRVTPPWPGFESVSGVFIELTVCGVTRPGFGEATGGFSPGDKVKAAVSDAIRNAAMRFGVALDLWSKEELESDEHEPARPPRSASEEPKWEGRHPAGSNNGSRPATENQIKAVQAIMHKHNIHEHHGQLDALSAIVGRTVDTFTALFHAEASEFIRTDGERLAEITRVGKLTITQTPDTDDPWANESPKVSRLELASLLRAFDKKGITGKDLRLSLASDVVGRELGSANDLTAAECVRVITAIESMTDPTQGESNA